MIKLPQYQPQYCLYSIRQYLDEYSLKNLERLIRKKIIVRNKINKFSFNNLLELNILFSIIESAPKNYKSLYKTLEKATITIKSNGLEIYSKNSIEIFVKFFGKVITDIEKILLCKLEQLNYYIYNGVEQIGFYPLIDDKSIIIDPNFNFGKPYLVGTGINTLSIYEMWKAGDRITTISNFYDIPRSLIINAIKFETLYKI